MAKRGAHGFTLSVNHFFWGRGVETLPAVPEWLLLLLSCCGVYLFAIFLLGLLTIEDFEQLD